MILSTYFLGSAMAAASGLPYEVVSMQCFNAVSKTLDYVQQSTSERGMAGAAPKKQFEVAHCLQSRKYPDSTFVYLLRPSDMKRVHGPVYYVDSSGTVTLRRDIPCDEHPNPDGCN